MKALMTTVLLLFLAFTIVPGTGPAEMNPDWMEVEEGKILTVRLPANPTTGYEWTFSISDPEVLELITSEYTPDAGSENLDGAGGTWTASFRGTASGLATLTLTYAASYDPTMVGDQVDIQVNVLDDLSLLTINVDEGALPWYESNPDKTVLVIRLPANETTGYAWQYTIEPEILELVTATYEEDSSAEQLLGAGGTWIASFRGVPGSSGEAALVLKYQRSGDANATETRVLTIQVSEDGVLEVLATATLN